MLRKKAKRGRDTLSALVALIQVRRLYGKGNAAVAERTAAAMRRQPTTQEQLDEAGVEAWHVARAVWRAKRFLPFHSTCLQTALATQMVFDRKGIDSVVRIGVRSIEADAHAWVEIGSFVLDDQFVANRFFAFEVNPSKARGGGA